MLEHSTAIRCPAHDDCPNCRGGQYAASPCFCEGHPVEKELEYEGKIYRPTSTETIERILELTQCPVTKLWCLICLCRRDDEDIKEEHVKHFFDLFHSHYWFFHKNLSLRVKLSIIDTIADFGPSLDRANATLITAMFRFEVMAHTVMQERDGELLVTQNLWPTVQATAHNGDMPVFTMRRICKTLELTPILAHYFHSMYNEILDCEVSMFASYIRITDRPALYVKFRNWLTTSDEILEQLPKR
jgi:hypothetical protein